MKKITLLLLCGLVSSAYADEGGVSFWLPGQFGSLAAAPLEKGWSLPLIYYHTTASADAAKNFPIGGRISAGLQADGNLMLAVPTYVFSNPVLGGQAAVDMAGIFGNVDVSANAVLTVPRGPVLSRNRNDSMTGFGDLYPSGSLRWNHGNQNTMLYGMLGVPTGGYLKNQLANLGTNHWSTDAGAGYTYLNTKNGHELSAVAGVTYNFINPATQYQNGVDGHLDWGASQFLSKQFHLGLVGYFYHQLSGDTGSGARLGPFESRVIGVGPQAGYLLKMGARHAYLNLKSYWEFDGRNRPEGWNSWVTVSLPL